MLTNEHEREVLRQFIKREVQPLLDRIEKLEADRRLADRLTDVIMMLDTPDAYNREYIAAVCRSILSSITRQEPQR